MRSAALILLASLGLAAQDQRVRTVGIEQRFRNLDTDHDGKLTRQELRAPRVFRRMDADGDGAVTMEEAQRSTGPRPADPRDAAVPVSADFQTWFSGLDADGDRSIEKGETDARTIRGADRNADGRVSVREGQRYHRDLLAKQAARENPSIFVPWTRTKGQRALRTAASGDPLLNLRFTRDLPTGEPDRNGVLITGTECMHLEAHRGMLFAALGGWNHDKDRLAWPGASVAVKRSASVAWEADWRFGRRTGRAGSLRSIVFTTDWQARPLVPPVPLLVAGVSGREDPGKVVVWSRDDGAGEWVKTHPGTPGGRTSPEVRVLFDHVDAVTGVHHAFAATSEGSLYRGAYDPESPGRIRWDDRPEITGRMRRFMAATEARGSAFLTIDLEPTEPENGGLFRRIDGPEPRWERLCGWTWSHPNPDMPRPWFGMRGLTALPDGTLLGAREHPGAIDRIDPRLAAGERLETEFDVRSALMDLWRVPEGGRGVMSIIAYNDMLPVTHPATGKPAHLIALGTRHPQGGRMRDSNEVGASAWYLVRYGGGEYGIGRVFDPAYPMPSRESGGLRATRTIRPSPFPEEEGRVWYFGGFDAFGGPSHLSTAWVYRGALPEIPEEDGP